MTDLGETPQTWRFGAYVLDAADRSLTRAGAPLPLAGRAFDLLVALARRQGRLVTKDELLDEVWPDAVVGDNNLQVHVSTLRKLLGPQAVQTVPGRGYRFQASLEPPSPAPAVPSPGPERSRIPEAPTPLLGRAADLRNLVESAGASRLVTVVGGAGVGKTRLAQAAASMLEGSLGGAVWVELAPVASGALVAGTVALALGLEPRSGEDALDVLVAALADRAVLLVLDNAEHLRPDVARLAGALCQRTRSVRMLVTSQVPLGLAFERIERLEPLPVPTAAVSPEEALRSGAVQLFVERARAGVRDFALDAGTVGPVLELCRRLDGIPLALELAAARLPALGLSATAARLDQRFRLLRRDAGEPRHRTLEAALDWSHELLDEPERMTLRRLGAFVGPFSLEAAVEVAGDEGEEGWAVVERLASLVDRSLVAVSRDEPPRYRLSETARAYARERLRRSGEARPIERASSHYESLGQAHVQRSENGAAVVEYSAALEVAALHRDRAWRDARELELLLALGPAVMASTSPGCSRCESIYGRAVELSTHAAPSARFRALWGRWQFLGMAGRTVEARQAAAEVAALAPELGDDAYAIEASHASMSTALLLGDVAEARAHAGRLLALHDPVRHAALKFDFGGHDPGLCALGQIAVATWLAGSTDEAIGLADRAVAAAQGVDHAYSEAAALYYACMVYESAGRIEQFERSAGALLALSTRHAMEVLTTEGRLFSARARFLRGAREEGLEEMVPALESILAGGELSFVPYYATLVVDALLAMRALDEAERWVGRTLPAANGGQGLFVPELHRLQAALAMARGHPERARPVLTSARAQAVEQGALALVARIDRDLAALAGGN